MILREHKPLFHGQIKNSLTRKLIFCLQVSFLKAGHSFQRRWQKRTSGIRVQARIDPPLFGFLRALSECTWDHADAEQLPRCFQNKPLGQQETSEDRTVFIQFDKTRLRTMKDELVRGEDPTSVV